jgi:ElaB/YqjD/DUF883 family membrane-anchored ribosome-binding protein
MLTPRMEAIVRQFRENGIKLLLEDPANVRELLNITQATILNLIDFDQLTLVRTTFVQRDYRHIEADVVLRGPLRGARGRRSPKGILIYILIEHQSEPDPLMPLRLLDYQVQIYKTQMRDWTRHHASLAGFRLQPVLPVVFYTGARTWRSIGQLVDLMAQGDRFARETPRLEPLFINLGTTPADQLEAGDGFFGWVLRLIQERRARPAAFQALLERAVQHLETMPAVERARWLEFLSYIHALVYHDRRPAEQPDLQETIEASVRTDEHRQEVKDMGKTIADVLTEKGRKEGRKEGRKQEALRSRKKTLLRQLQGRFGDLPAEIARVIEATTNVPQLETWLDLVVKAPTLADMEITSPAKSKRDE